MPVDKAPQNNRYEAVILQHQSKKIIKMKATKKLQIKKNRIAKFNNKANANKAKTFYATLSDSY